jgi:transcriptional regulator with XRE-family HTH domain
MAKDLDRAKEIIPFGPRMTLGERLVAARENAGLTVRQAANLLKVEPSVIRNNEELGSGTTEPTKTICKFAATYCVSAEWLSRGEPDIGHTALVELAIEFKKKRVPPGEARGMLLMIEMLAKKDGDKDAASTAPV